MHFPTELPVIVTPRLHLRPFTATDAVDVQRLAGERSVAETTANIPHPYPDGAAEMWIASHPEKWAARQELVLAITGREDGRLMGAIGLIFQGTHESAELGYWIGLPFWGKGFATEAARAVVDYTFAALRFNRVQAHHMARNPASGRVLLKAGLRPEGASPQALKKNGCFEDVALYGVLLRDWPGADTPAIPPA